MQYPPDEASPVTSDGPAAAHTQPRQQQTEQQAASNGSDSPDTRQRLENLEFAARHMPEVMTSALHEELSKLRRSGQRSDSH